MSQTVETQFGTGTVVDRESVRGRVSYKVEGPGFSTWVEASALPQDFQWMPGPDDIQNNSVTLPYNPAPQTWVNPHDQNIVPGRQSINPQKRTAPADSLALQEEGESYEPGPASHLFATGGLSPEDIQAKLGPKYVNAFETHDFTSLQARLTEHPELVLSEYRERVAELATQADHEYLSRVGRNEALEASDPQIREAAWKDVRAKAVRLRKSGQVNLRGATPDVIATQVTGDHGTYEVMVMRSNIFQGSSAVDSWSCECPWGQWAWKREHSFVGRMCSHAYASLMELQSLSKSKKPNPKFRNHPAVWASRTAESLETVIDYARDNVYDTLAENGLDIHDPEAYDLIQETWRSSLGMYEDMYGLEIPQDVYERYASRTAEVVDIGTKIFHRDYADIYGTVIEDDGTAYLVADGPGGEYWIDHEDARLASRTAEIVDIRPVGWDPYSRNLMNRLRTLWEEGSRPGQQKKRNEEIRELVTELRDRGFATDGVIATLRKGFLDEPLGYDDIPDYGTSEDYVRLHERDNLEDVTELEFDYTPGTDDGVLQEVNDGTRAARYTEADFEDDGVFEGDPADDFPADEYGVVNEVNDGLDHIAAADDYQYGEPPAYGSGDEFGGDENPYYVDPAEQEGWDDPFPDDDEDNIVANFQRNAGWLMGGNEGSGGNDDIAAAAEAHLRTAGRNFTMAEQQALIDEDDGQPYDRNNLRLRGTHYETGF